MAARHELRRRLAGHRSPDDRREVPICNSGGTTAPASPVGRRDGPRRNSWRYATSCGEICLMRCNSWRYATSCTRRPVRVALCGPVRVAARRPARIAISGPAGPPGQAGPSVVGHPRPLQQIPPIVGQRIVGLALSGRVSAERRKLLKPGRSGLDRGLVERVGGTADGGRGDRPSPVCRPVDGGQKVIRSRAILGRRSPATYHSVWPCRNWPPQSAATRYPNCNSWLHATSCCEICLMRCNSWRYATSCGGDPLVTGPRMTAARSRSATRTGRQHRRARLTGAMPSQQLVAGRHELRR